MIRLSERGVTPSRKAAALRPKSVAVVGGSAAGFFTAYLLARHGTDVQVLERSENLEPAARTLIVTHRMRNLLGRFAENCVVNQIRQFELFTDGRSASISLSQPDLVIERATLIRGLAEQACRIGTKLSLGRRFQGLTPAGRGLEVEVQRSGGSTESVYADAVVGSDGAASSVAQAAG